MVQINKLLKTSFWIVFGLIALQLAKAAGTTIGPYSGGGTFSGVLDPLMDLLQYILVDAPTQMGSLYFKALLFFLMTVLLLTVTPKIPPFKDGDENTKKYGKIAAWLISLTMVVFIPDTLILSLIGIYSTVGILIAFVLVPLVLIFSTKTLGNRGKGVVYFFVGLIMLFYLQQVINLQYTPATPPATGGTWGSTGSFSTLISKILPFLRIIAIGLVIYGIYLFFTKSGDEWTAKAEEVKKIGDAKVKIAESEKDTTLGVKGHGKDEKLGSMKIGSELEEGKQNKGLDQGEAHAIRALAEEISLAADETFKYEGEVKSFKTFAESPANLNAANKYKPGVARQASDLSRSLTTRSTNIAKKLKALATSPQFPRLGLLYKKSFGTKLPVPAKVLKDARQRLVDSFNKFKTTYNTVVRIRRR